MKYLLPALAAIVVVGCSQPPPPEPHPNPRKIEGAQGYYLGEPIKHGNAEFIPVLSEPPPEPRDDLVTLAEAKKNGWVEIIEVPGMEAVDTLTVRNTGPKTILLIAGELLLGGKQDRVVAKDAMVPPGEERKVAVYCVEQGRWSGSAHFEYSGGMVPDRVRKAAQYASQMEVWDNVGVMNRTVPAESSSIREFVGDENVKTRVKDGIGSVRARLQDAAGDKEVVGVVFVLNGEIKTFELFASGSLFTQAIEGLLSSFLTEAALAPEAAGTVDKAKVEKFVARCLEPAIQPAEAGLGEIEESDLVGRTLRTDSESAAAHGSFAPNKK